MFSIDAVGTGSDDQHQLQKSIEELFLNYNYIIHTYITYISLKQNLI